MICLSGIKRPLFVLNQRTGKKLCYSKVWHFFEVVWLQTHSTCPPLLSVCYLPCFFDFDHWPVYLSHKLKTSWSQSLGLLLHSYVPVPSMKPSAQSPSYTYHTNMTLKRVVFVFSVCNKITKATYARVQFCTNMIRWKRFKAF